MLRHIKIVDRLGLLIGIFVLGFIAYGLWSFKTLNEIKVGGPVFDRIAQSQRLIADVLPPPAYIVESYLVCLQIANVGDDAQRGALIERLRNLRKQHQGSAEFWRKAGLDQALSETLLHQAYVPALAFYTIAFNEFLPAVQRNDRIAIAQSLAKLTDSYDTHRLAVNRVVVLAKDRAQKDERWATAYVEHAAVRQMAILVLSLSLGVWLAVLIRFSITRPLTKAVAIARSVAAGELNVQTDENYPDETGQLLVALREMGKSVSTMMTALTASEATSRHARELLEQLIDTANVMVIGLDFSGQVTLFNAVAEQVTGYRRAEIMGKKWVELGLLAQPSIWQMLTPPTTEGPRTHEQDIVTKSGERRTISWRNSSQVQAAGSRVALISFGIDVSEQLRAEHALVEAKQIAEAANLAKSAFLANMSHELRTPLNAIMGFAQLLQRDSGLGEEGRKKLAIINRAGLHLLSLINNVLEISRIEAGRVALQRAPLDLAALQRSIDEMIRGRAEAKGLAFRMECATDLPAFVTGDEHRLKQVLINLLGNAVKYTDHGSVGLRVSRRDDEMKFEVFDTGPGIMAEDRERIFQPFFQTDIGIAKGEGTGLGLAISLEYARLMEGTLAVESQVGRGSVFVLRVPLPESAAPVEEGTVGRVVGLESGQERVRTLVVDDEADNRELAKQFLESAGFEVCTANNGQQAVQAFLRWQPAFIWMDMRMPVLDGYEATRQIRSLPGGKQVKIVALTASAFEEDREKILAAGCDDMIKKPIEESRLFALMGVLLGLHFRYEQDDPRSMPKPDRLTDLSSLPASLRMELHTAAEMLDLEAVRTLIERIRATEPAVAKGLDALVAEFRFDTIGTLCEAP